jgi:hypothetical protein
MDEERPESEYIWESGWDGHEIAQRRRLSKLSLAEKLEWLEDAHRLVLQFERARSRERGEEPK